MTRILRVYRGTALLERCVFGRHEDMVAVVCEWRRRGRLEGYTIYVEIQERF